MQSRHGNPRDHSPARMTAGQHPAASGAQRPLAWLAIGCAVVLTVVLISFSLGNVLALLAVLVGMAIGAAGGWWLVTEHPPRRWFGLAGALVGLAIIVAAVIAVDTDADRPLLRLAIVVALFVVMCWAACTAVVQRLHALDDGRDHAVSPPRHPVLICNPWSGGGKVEQFGLVDLARELGIETVHARPRTRSRAARPRRDRPRRRLPRHGGRRRLAGPRRVDRDRARRPVRVRHRRHTNHFALDLGLDRDDPRSASHAFRDAVERRIDYATVNGRFFVNNVSLGVYADDRAAGRLPRRQGRDDEGLLPELLGRHRARSTCSSRRRTATRSTAALLIHGVEQPYALDPPRSTPGNDAASTRANLARPRCHRNVRQGSGSALDAVGQRPGRRRGLRGGRLRAAGRAARRARRAPARRRGGDRARPPGQRGGPHAGVSVRALGGRGRPARRGGGAAVLLRPARAPQAHARLLAARDPRRLLRAAHLGRRAAFAAAHARVRELEATLAELRERAGARERELDLLEFELQEIEAADPREEEKAELRAARERLRHLEALRGRGGRRAGGGARDGDGVDGACWPPGAGGSRRVAASTPGSTRWPSAGAAGLRGRRSGRRAPALRRGARGRPGRAGGHRGAPGRARAPGAQARRHDRRRPRPRRALPRAPRRARRRRGRARARGGRARGGARRAGDGGGGAASGAGEGRAAAGGRGPRAPGRAGDGGRELRDRPRGARGRARPAPTPSSS